MHKWARGMIGYLAIWFCLRTDEKFILRSRCVAQAAPGSCWRGH